MFSWVRTLFLGKLLRFVVLVSVLLLVAGGAWIVAASKLFGDETFVARDAATSDTVTSSKGKDTPVVNKEQKSADATPKPAPQPVPAPVPAPTPSGGGTQPAPQPPIGGGISTPPPSGGCSGAAWTPGATDPWGGCWPGEGVTGVPAGVVLSEYTGPCTITTPGTVIDASHISCMLTIQASNVVIKRSIITMPGSAIYAIRIQSGSILVEDTEIDGDRQQGTLVSSGGAAVNGSNYTLRRVNIHHVYEGPRVGSNVTIEDSYIHHLVRCQLATESCHVDALQSTSGSAIVIRHNTILSYNPDVSDIFNASYIVKADLGDISGVIIEQNYMSGGNYTLYVKDAAYTTRGVAVRNNYFGRDYRYGTRSVDASTGTVWENNRFSDGSLITL